MAASTDDPEKPANGRHPGLSHEDETGPPLTTDADYDAFSARPLKTTQLLFAGRVGGNQEFIINRHDPVQAALLRKTPDAAPFMSLADAFDLTSFRQVDLWKAAFIEGIGKFPPIIRVGTVGGKHRLGLLPAAFEPRQFPWC